MVHIEFEKVATKRTKRWKDKDGRRRQLTREFFQTINPWNVTKLGIPKTREQIMQELRAEADAWLAEPPAEMEA